MKTFREIECGDSIYISWIDDKLSREHKHVWYITVHGTVLELYTGNPENGEPLALIETEDAEFGSGLGIVYQEDDDPEGYPRVVIESGYYERDFFINNNLHIISTNTDCLKEAVRQLLLAHCTELSKKKKELLEMADDLESCEEMYLNWCSEWIKENKL